MLDNLEQMIATIERASNQILSRIGGPVECLLMLGTGLGSIAKKVVVEFRFSYEEIPGFPVSTAPTLYLDAANKKSYPGTGTTWSDLAGSNNGTLTNGPTFDSGNGGSMDFDGTDDKIHGHNFSL